MIRRERYMGGEDSSFLEELGSLFCKPRGSKIVE